MICSSLLAQALRRVSVLQDVYSSDFNNVTEVRPGSEVGPRGFLEASESHFARCLDLLLQQIVAVRVSFLLKRTSAVA